MKQRIQGMIQKYKGQRHFHNLRMDSMKKELAERKATKGLEAALEMVGPITDLKEVIRVHDEVIRDLECLVILDSMKPVPLGKSDIKQWEPTVECSKDHWFEAVLEDIQENREL